MSKSKPKTLKIICSGSFKASDGDIESFDNVVGIIPAVDEDKARQMVNKRYAQIWIGQAKKKVNGVETDEGKYKRVTKVRTVDIDSIEDNDDVLDYIGMNVLEMNWEQLQDFATANDLSAVPLFKTASLHHARKVAWSEAARKIMGWVGPEFMWTDQTFRPAAHEPIIADGVIRRAGGHVADIEETIDREALALQGKAKASVTDTSKSQLTLPQLKAIADEKKVTYHATIGWQQLFDKIYKAKKVA